MLLDPVFDFTETFLADRSNPRFFELPDNSKSFLSTASGTIILEFYLPISQFNYQLLNQYHFSKSPGQTDSQVNAARNSVCPGLGRICVDLR